MNFLLGSFAYFQKRFAGQGRVKIFDWIIAAIFLRYRASLRAVSLETWRTNRFPKPRFRSCFEEIFFAHDGSIHGTDTMYIFITYEFTIRI